LSREKFIFSKEFLTVRVKEKRRKAIILQKRRKFTGKALHKMNIHNINSYCIYLQSSEKVEGFGRARCPTYPTGYARL
jgi:hypothetical protein